MVLLAVLLVFIWSTVSLGFKLDRLVELPAKLASLFEQMFLPPDWGYLSDALPEMMISIEMAWIGTLIGAALSLPLGFFAAHNVSPRPVSVTIRVLLDAIRAFPEIVLAVVIFVPIAGLGPFAGALAIGIHSVGTLGKLTAEAIESIDPGPVEAARASGASGLQAQRWGVLPQVLPEIIAFWLYRFEVNVRAAAVLGVVGAGRHRGPAGGDAPIRPLRQGRHGDHRHRGRDAGHRPDLGPGASSGHRRSRQPDAHRRAGAHRSHPRARRRRPADCRRIRVLASVPPTLTCACSPTSSPPTRSSCAPASHARPRSCPGSLRPPCAWSSRAAESDRRRPTGTAPRSSAIGTGSSTPRHSGASSTRRRCSSIPEGDHYVTRLTHTLQVTQIARSLAGALSLNETLAEAIALGHDVGHSPFGHTGEDALSPYFLTTGGWHHAAQSVRIFEVLEDLNLTWEVRDGIRAHSWRIEPPPATQEAMCVRYADRIAYLTHDALDAIRAGLLDRQDFPASVSARFGPWAATGSGA